MYVLSILHSPLLCQYHRSRFQRHTSVNTRSKTQGATNWNIISGVSRPWIYAHIFGSRRYFWISSKKCRNDTGRARWCRFSTFDWTENTLQPRNDFHKCRENTFLKSLCRKVLTRHGSFSISFHPRIKLKGDPCRCQSVSNLVALTIGHVSVPDYSLLFGQLFREEWRKKRHDKYARVDSVTLFPWPYIDFSDNDTYLYMFVAVTFLTIYHWK